jgi:hypothetical protein
MGSRPCGERPARDEEALYEDCRERLSQEPPLCTFVVLQRRGRTPADKRHDSLRTACLCKQTFADVSEAQLGLNIYKGNSLFSIRFATAPRACRSRAARPNRVARASLAVVHWQRHPRLSNRIWHRPNQKSHPCRKGHHGASYKRSIRERGS